MLKLNKSGISIIALTVSMFIILTLLSVITFSLINNYNKSKKIGFANELDMIQLAVDSYYASNLKYPVSQSIKLSGEAVDKFSDQFSGEDYDEQGYIFSIIDYEKIQIKNLKYGNNKNGISDVYVVSQKTGKVYYAPGLKIGDKYYYTIENELGSVLGKNSDGVDSVAEDGILFSESYLSDGRKQVTIKVPKKYTVSKVKAENDDITSTRIEEDNYGIYNNISNDAYTISVEYLNADSKSKVARYLVDETSVAEISYVQDIYVKLYTDGALVFSNKNITLQDKIVSKDYGNIKDVNFTTQIVDEVITSNSPWYNDRESIGSVIVQEKIQPTNMRGWFLDCKYLTDVDFGNIDTSKVTDMGLLFQNCTNLTAVNLNKFNTKNVTTMERMFYNCLRLTSLDLTSFDTKNVTNMEYMFSMCSATEIKVRKSLWVTDNVTSSDHMFENAYVDSVTKVD